MQDAGRVSRTLLLREIDVNYSRVAYISVIGFITACSELPSMNEEMDEPDIVVEEEYSSVEQLNQRLPEGVYFDQENQYLVVHGEKYEIRKLVSKMKSRAKEKGPATYGLTIGGVTLGLLIAGPIGGAAMATVASIIGALYDKGYIEFTEEGLKLNIGEGSGYIQPDEEAKLDDPMEVHADKWYEPDSDTYVVAIELPDGDRRYYKTEEGAANRLIHEYGM